MHDLILEATARAENQPSTSPPAKTEKVLKDIIFLHFQYHPDNLSHQQNKEEFEDHLGQICKDDLGISHTVVAYSRPKNIGDYVSQAKLHQAPGGTSSEIMGKYKQGFNPS